MWLKGPTDTSVPKLAFSMTECVTFDLSPIVDALTVLSGPIWQFLPIMDPCCMWVFGSTDVSLPISTPCSI